MLKREESESEEPATQGSASPPDIPQTDPKDTETYVEEKAEHQPEPQQKDPAWLNKLKRAPMPPPSQPHRESTMQEDTTAASKMAHDENMWAPVQKHKVQTTSTPNYPKPKGTSPMGSDPFAAKSNPNPDKDDGYAKPKSASAYPRGNPANIPVTSESLTTRILEAPRRAKERAEEIGAKAEKYYNDKRVAPVTKAALETYTSRMAENERKYRSGEINETMYRSRQQKYMNARDEASKPLEKRLVGDINNLGQGGMIRNTFDTFARGAVGERTPAERKAGMNPISVLEKAGETYRPSPQPRFRAGKGTRQTSPTKGTVITNTKNAIDFSRGGFGAGAFTGAKQAAQSPAFNFNTPLFGGQSEAPAKGKKKGR